MYKAVNTWDAKKCKELVDTLNIFQRLKEDCAVWTYEESFCVFLWYFISGGINNMDWLKKLENYINCVMFQNFNEKHIWFCMLEQLLLRDMSFETET